jgi:hypothetical protein
VHHDGKLHRLKEARCLVSLRPIQVLAQDQEPEGTGGRHVTKLPRLFGFSIWMDAKGKKMPLNICRTS